MGNNMNDSEIVRAMKWISSGDTGTSSKAIWRVMTGILVYPETPAVWIMNDIPWDPSDFGRCYRLLSYIPEWKSRMEEVSARWPEWGPMVREWGKLTELYEKALDQKATESPEMYWFMRTLVEEGREQKRRDCHGK